MKSKHFTFFYMPRDGDGLKTVRVPKWLAFGVPCLALVLCLSAGGIVFKSISGLAGSSRLLAVKDENALLNSKLKRYAVEIESLKRQVQQNFEFQKKARLLASLEDLTADVTEVGVGGPEVDRGGSLSWIGGEAQGTVGLIDRDLDKLMRQARLQKESYQEIIDKLSASQALLDATPSIRPVATGFISSRFGRRMDPFTGRTSSHRGIDYSARLGTPIFATADGVVSFSGKLVEFGWTVEVSHGYGFVTRYAHCSKLLVQEGQRVKRGEVIARVGSSGRSTATHLHYEIVLDGSRRNPLAYVLSRREVVD
jgi:murein DD-endopeptidase MepM/ murein hydrolase activator NlpD